MNIMLLLGVFPCRRENSPATAKISLRKTILPQGIYHLLAAVAVEAKLLKLLRGRLLLAQGRFFCRRENIPAGSGNRLRQTAQAAARKMSLPQGKYPCRREDIPSGSGSRLSQTAQAAASKTSLPQGRYPCRREDFPAAGKISLLPAVAV